MSAYDDARVTWGKDLNVRQLDVGEAIGAALRPRGEQDYIIEFRNDSGEVKGVRPATPLESRMWLMLTDGENAWGSAFFENPDGVDVLCGECRTRVEQLFNSIKDHPSTGKDEGA